MISSCRPDVGTKRISNYVELHKRRHRVNTAPALSIEKLLHIIRRFTQYFRNDYLGVEEYSRYRDGDNYIFVPDLHRQHETFARQWDRNLHAQGFLEAFTDKSIRG
jgi:hypothetical protein